ncbi:hypothetical protein [uncultured Ruegeria sp.]|uniref:hypothetical protein n=1 Tax=uncultured Ruegeria sp. TaxID=259304 RepID=UPI0026261554|nr:hypothetical protein [uncultured Ruegeria sp.]
MMWRRWSVEWFGRLQGENGDLPLFKTRQECREFINERYGYIKSRPDLRRAPYSWRLPRPVRVVITAEQNEAET